MNHIAFIEARAAQLRLLDGSGPGQRLSRRRPPRRDERRVHGR